MSEPIHELLTDDDVEVFERGLDTGPYPERNADLHRSRSRIPLRDCSNPACPARVQMGIPHCCEECRAADAPRWLLGNGDGVRIEPHEHSEKCQTRQRERGVTL